MDLEITAALTCCPSQQLRPRWRSWRRCPVSPGRHRHRRPSRWYWCPGRHHLDTKRRNKSIVWLLHSQKVRLDPKNSSKWSDVRWIWVKKKLTKKNWFINGEEEDTFTIDMLAFTWIGNELDGKFPFIVAFLHLRSAVIIHELLELHNREWMVKSCNVKSFYSILRPLAVLDFNTGKAQQDKTSAGDAVAHLLIGAHAQRSRTNCALQGLSVWY